MAKRFSKQYRNKEWAFIYVKSYVKIPGATLHTCFKESSSIFYYVKLILDIKRPVTSLVNVDLLGMPSPFYPASVALLQLHGGMVSHMKILPTPSSTVHNTTYLDPYH